MWKTVSRTHQNALIKFVNRKEKLQKIQKTVMQLIVRQIHPTFNVGIHLMLKRNVNLEKINRSVQLRCATRIQLGHTVQKNGAMRKLTRAKTDVLNQLPKKIVSGTKFALLIFAKEKMIKLLLIAELHIAKLTHRMYNAGTQLMLKSSVNMEM
jgi:hypothetical protein